MRTSIALFTRDLRVSDNPMLYAAVAGADRVVPLFVLDPKLPTPPNRAAFLLRCLTDLDDALRDLGGALIVRHGDPVTEVSRLIAEHGVSDVHVSADVSGYAQRRQGRLEAIPGVGVHVHETVTTAAAPGSLTPTGGGDHFSVFTPYLRRWQTAASRIPLPPPSRITIPEVESAGFHDVASGEGLPAPELAEGGERTGRALLSEWVDGPVAGYADGRDDLAGDRTSRLSPHLHFGTLSPVEVLYRVGRDSQGAREFGRQLAWRDFHHQMLAARPRTAREDYRPRGDRWRDAPEELAAWREGRTGYPIVDAGMRQLLREGWMHNRARMITASFLTKTLYVDWREGARHFQQHLVDADVANNQLNWQWVAGTGADTRPNRVLNPLRQAMRYDPSGDYVRRYVPELDCIPGAAVHEPWNLPVPERRALTYPGPVVDLADGRQRFLSARNA
ncbi:MULTISPECIES: cryptochrome/photolyase family protein [Prauserella salsuginis group]|uniref:Cryptochrome/photolyase family protein n=1 Tax=Prauserella salsuginis TaxID=387889 RepID=A0ABW6G903_9PSEU|nr:MULTISPECIES: deoxyribodipyrimidine photo-lyase [Prauserella salsuginis group]MCR3722493.1 deoxyribodipyrimidine photo-lyase [Prauserella flava]MCR3736935.1 deoxyribodipyrimidine photo-lyase [Prauserella salsuginis]